MMELSILPEFQALASTERRATLVVKISPPRAPIARPAVHIVMALDISGSMGGDKISTAVQSAQALVRALGPNDTFACVTFSDQVSTLVPTLPMTSGGKAMALEKLSSARADGSTDLAAAALRTLALANELREGGRALLLTDGCPTSGVTDNDQIVRLTQGAMGRSTLSTFGFGRDVDAPVLSSLADVGRGNYTFIEAGEPPIAAIGAELGGMLLTVAADVQLSLKPSPGVKVERILRPDGTAIDPRSGAATVDLPPLIAEEPIFVVFELSWLDAVVGRPLGLVAIRARSTETGELVVKEALVSVEQAAARGAMNGDAVREIIVARAAVLLDRMSRNQVHPFREAIAELTERYGELTGLAHSAGLDSDGQVVAALAMIRSAREGFESNASAARQDMVASAMALKRKRSTYSGSSSPAHYGTFATRSQLLGTSSLVDDAAGSPVPPAQRGPGGAAKAKTSEPESEDEGPMSRR